MTNYIKGLDVSIVQGNIDFNAVKQSGIQFVMLRCYVGNNGPDVNYPKYLQEATDAGLYVGSYNFPFPLPGTGTRTSQYQAETHFNACKTSVAACDAEWPPFEQWQKWGCSAQQINDWFLAYLERYTQLAGTAPLVYTFPYFEEKVNFSSDWGNYDLWIASYEPTPFIPAPWKNKGWRMWQTTGGGGHLPNGVPVDTDVCPDLSLWGVTTAAPPAPSPPPVAAPPVAAPPASPAPSSGGLLNSLTNLFTNFFKNP